MHIPSDQAQKLCVRLMPAGIYLNVKVNVAMQIRSSCLGKEKDWLQCSDTELILHLGIKINLRLNNKTNLYKVNSVKI